MGGGDVGWENELYTCNTHTLQMFQSSYQSVIRISGNEMCARFYRCLRDGLNKMAEFVDTLLATSALLLNS